MMRPVLRLATGHRNVLCRLVSSLVIPVELVSDTI